LINKVRLDVFAARCALNYRTASHALKNSMKFLKRSFPGNSNTNTANMGGIKRTADIMNYWNQCLNRSE